MKGYQQQPGSYDPLHRIHLLPVWMFLETGAA